MPGICAMILGWNIESVEFGRDDMPSSRFVPESTDVLCSRMVGLRFSFFPVPHHRGRCSEGETQYFVTKFHGIGGMERFEDGIYPSLRFPPLVCFMW